VLSLFWFGQMLVFGHERNLFYFNPADESTTCVMSLEKPAVVATVLLDRIILVSNREKPVVNSRPAVLLEPLLLSLIQTKQNSIAVKVAEKAESC
jgi:hypothetical protein